MSVDIEAAGPTPARYAMLSLGASVVGSDEGFYVELQPDRDETLPAAMAVHGLSMRELADHGEPPRQAMESFATWIERMAPPGERYPVFVALNAPFDWMFVDDYFHRYLGRNPFGHSALDIKAFYMGLHGLTWGEAHYSNMQARYGQVDALTHNALQDARDQGTLFGAMLAEALAVGPARADDEREERGA